MTRKKAIFRVPAKFYDWRDLGKAITDTLLIIPNILAIEFVHHEHDSVIRVASYGCYRIFTGKMEELISLKDQIEQAIEAWYE